MPAYAIFDVYITDEDTAARYRELSTPSIEQYGGRFHVRGGPVEVFEGEWTPKRLVVIEFADADAVRRWYDSPEYGEARAVRESAGTWNMVVVEGV